MSSICELLTVAIVIVSALAADTPKLTPNAARATSFLMFYPPYARPTEAGTLAVGKLNPFSKPVNAI
jgi:hypothetical protein